MADIVQDHALLAEIIEKKKREGKKIVFGNGCFNILHVGHIRYLKEAKALGDILVLAINDDESVRKLKGDDYPVIPLSERMEILASLIYVDYVTPFKEERVDKLLLLLKPHIHAKGTDYTKESVPEKDIVLSFGGEIKIVGDPKNHSTTEIIKRIKSQNPNG